MGFLDYWDVISPKLSSGDLPQRESMRRLNKARVALKHSGIHPAARELDSFASAVRSFFQESVPLIFGVTLDSISLADFVSCGSARTSLEGALACLGKGNLEEGFVACAEAFHGLIEDYEHRKCDQYYKSPFFFGERLTFLDSFHMRLAPGDDLARFVDRVKESIEALQEAVKVLSLGLDYRRYTRFQLLTPHIERTAGGYALLGSGKTRGLNVSKDDLSFCIEFVIESAFRLQEFDFDYRDLLIRC